METNCDCLDCERARALETKVRALVLEARLDKKDITHHVWAGLSQAERDDPRSVLALLKFTKNS